MAVVKLSDTQLLATMTDPASSPRLRARKFQKGAPFSRPAGSLQIAQPGGGAPIELEVAGAFRVSSVRSRAGGGVAGDGRASREHRRWGGPPSRGRA
jgi:hypothetical protein